MDSRLRTIVVALIGWLLSVPAARAANLAEIELFGSDDSDHTQQSLVLLKGSTDVALSIPGGVRLGAAAGSRMLSADAGNEHFTVGRLEGGAHPWSGSEIELMIETLRGDDWNPTLGSARIGQTLEHWHLEASAEHNIVDTVASVADRVRFDSVSVSADYRIGRHWTAVLGGSAQDFSDGNNRIGRVGRLVYAPDNANWNLQARVRRLDADFQSSGYFSPRRLEEALFIGKLGGPVFHQRFSWSLQLGAGEQRIDGTDAKALYTGELGLRGWFTDHWGMDAKAECSNIGELSGQQAGGSYHYCQATLGVKRAW